MQRQAICTAGILTIFLCAALPASGNETHQFQSWRGVSTVQQLVNVTGSVEQWRRPTQLDVTPNDAAWDQEFTVFGQDISQRVRVGAAWMTWPAVVWDLNTTSGPYSACTVSESVAAAAKDLAQVPDTVNEMVCTKRAGHTALPDITLIWKQSKTDGTFQVYMFYVASVAL